MTDPVPEAGAGLAPAGASPGYRPTSLVAVLGFALAALYALFLVVCWGMALLSGAAFLLPAALLLPPVAAFLVCGGAWVAMWRWEGVRAGSGLAQWGMVLSALCLLSYGGYLAARYAALRPQAEAFAAQWLELIRQGKTDDAYCLTLPPEERPTEGPGRRRELEFRFNGGHRPTPHAPLTLFRQGDLIRLLNHAGTAAAGAETVIKPLGFRSLGVGNRGYRVALDYEVNVPQGSLLLRVVVLSVERRREGRQWFVLLGPGQTAIRDFRDDPLDRRIRELKKSSGAFMQAWLQKLQDGQTEAAFLDTLEPARRTQPQAEHAAGYAAFLQGSLVHVPDTFWAEGAAREQLPAAVRQMFLRPDQKLIPFLQPEITALPLWQREGERLFLAQDVHLAVEPGYLVQGALVFDTDARALEGEGGTSPAWRVARLDLYNARKLPGPPRPFGTVVQH